MRNAIAVWGLALSAILTEPSRAQDDFPTHRKINFDSIAVRMAYNPIQDEAYVVLRRDESNDFSDELVVVCTQQYQVLRRLWIGRNPQGVAVSHDGSRVFVARGGDRLFGEEEGDGTLHIFDTDTWEQTDVALGGGISRPELALIGDDRVVVSARFRSEFRVVHLDREFLVESFGGTSSRGRIVVDPREQFLFVGGEGTPTPEKFAILPKGLERVPFEIPEEVADGSHLELDSAGKHVAFRSGEFLDSETGELIGRTAAGMHAFGTDPATLFVARPPDLVDEYDPATLEKLSEYDPRCDFDGLLDFFPLRDRGGYFMLTEGFLCMRGKKFECPPPVAPSPVGPIDASIYQFRDLLLSWSSDDAVCNEVFEVRLDTVNPPVRVVTDRDRKPFFWVSGLAHGTTYYWQVLTSNLGGTAEGPVWSFTTKPCSIPRHEFEVPLGDDPTAIEYDPRKKVAYVLVPARRQILKFSPVSREVEGSIELPKVPTAMELAREGDRLYVPHAGEPTLSIVDLESDTIEELELPWIEGQLRHWRVLELTSDRLIVSAYVVREGRPHSSVTIVPLDGQQERVPIIDTDWRRHVALSPNRTTLLVALEDSEINAYRLSPEGVIASWKLGHWQEPIYQSSWTFHPDGSRIYTDLGRVFETRGLAELARVQVGNSRFGERSDRLFYAARNGIGMIALGSTENAAIDPLPFTWPAKAVDFVVLPNDEGFVGVGTGMILGNLVEPTRSLSPTECEPDCDRDLVPDDYAIASQMVADCNGSGVPDICDVANRTSRDVNLNSYPDECEIRLKMPFLRGDTDANGERNLSDAVQILQSLFAGVVVGIPCEDAADADDSGAVNLSDAIYVLSHLFQGGAVPPEPSWQCGRDPSFDQLNCRAFMTCELPTTEVEFFGTTFDLNGAHFLVERSSSSQTRGEFSLGKREVARVLATLPHGFEFSITIVDRGTLSFPPTAPGDALRPARADTETIQAAIEFIEAVPGGSGSCLASGFLEALSFARASSATRGAIIHSGKGRGTCNSAGVVESEYLESLARTLKLENLGKIPIHTFGIFLQLNGLGNVFLRDLAECHDGVYTRVDP